MKNYKKLVVIPLSTVLSLGILVPNIGAETLAHEQQERIQVRIASTASEVSKTDLINKVKTLFPGKFDFLKESDFENNKAAPKQKVLGQPLIFRGDFKCLN